MMQRHAVGRLAWGIALALAFAGSDGAVAQEPKVCEGYVLLEGGQGIAPMILDIAQRVIPEKLQRRRQDDASAPLAPTRLRFISIGQLDERMGRDSAGIYLLHLAWPTNSNVAPEQMDAAWEAARAELESTIRSIQSMAQVNRRMQTERQLDELAKQRAMLQEQMKKVSDELQKRAAAAGGSRQQFEALLTQAQQRQRELALSRTSATARREAIERRIDELRATANAAKEEDPLIKEYGTIVDIREQQLANAQAANRAGQAVASELAEAKAELAMAKVELIKAARAAEEHSAGPILRELNDDLSRLIIQAAELEAQLLATEKMIAELAQQVDVGTQVELESAQFEGQMSAIRHRLQQVEESYGNVEQIAASMRESEVTIQPLNKELPVARPQDDAESE